MNNILSGGANTTSLNSECLVKSKLLYSEEKNSNQTDLTLKKTARLIFKLTPKTE